MDFIDYNYIITCISHGRHDTIKKLFSIVGTEDVLFFVKDQEDRNNYIKAGARYVLPVGSLMESRNASLEFCFSRDKISVQLSDDLVKISLNNFDGKRSGVSMTVVEVLNKIIPIFNKSKYKFAGFPPTDNPFFSMKEEEYNKFIVGDFILVKPNDLRFDQNLHLKEDYDYTLQNIKENNGCVRYGYFLNTFKHYSNKGGAVSYRNDNLEQKTIDYLISKWGSCISKNSKRENEILLNKNCYEILHSTQIGMF